VIVAREFSRPIEVLIASQPTRGLDVGSIEYIHNRIVQKRDEGTAILVVSSELDEILALSDRIAVMYRGRIMEIVEASQVDKEYLGLLMAGIEPSKAAKGGARKKKDTDQVERVF
jgi:simple sugar transport system ATP-binding protein